MQEKINRFLVENDISIFVVGDTNENMFQLHYGITVFGKIEIEQKGSRM